jgi:hypothetical protein
MTDLNENEERLERLLNDAFRALPPRRAPPSLETRVLRELHTRLALHWWRRDFGYWPLPARGVFIAICAALISLTVLDGGFEIGSFRLSSVLDAMTPSWTRPVMAVIASTDGLSAAFARALPPDWLYGGLGVGALLYAILFGLAGAAYRVLYLRPFHR